MTTLQDTASLLQDTPRRWTPPSRISPVTEQTRPAYDNLSFRYVTIGAESEQPVGAPFYQWVGAETMQESLVFLILGVGRLREDQLIYCM